MTAKEELTIINEAIDAYKKLGMTLKLLVMAAKERHEPINGVQKPTKKKYIMDIHSEIAKVLGNNIDLECVVTSTYKGRLLTLVLKCGTQGAYEWARRNHKKLKAYAIRKCAVTSVKIIIR